MAADAFWKSLDSHIETDVPGMSGAWEFGRIAGLTDAEVNAQCAYNKAPGARNAPMDRIVRGSPVVNDDFIQCRNGYNGFKSLLRDPVNPALPGGRGEVTVYCTTRCTDSDLGNPDNTATPFFLGMWGGADGKGHGLNGNSDNSIRAIAVRSGGVVVPSQLALPTGTLDVFRIYAYKVYYDGAEWRLTCYNLSDETNSGATALTGGALGGRLFMMIGLTHLDLTYFGKTVDMRNARCWLGANHNENTMLKVRDEMRLVNATCASDEIRAA